MNIYDFKAKWRDVSRSERSASQKHFLDLCDALGVPKPADIDREGERYTFERGVAKTGGGKGFADVWRRNHFAWEYKGPGRDLDAAYEQLLQYREDLENPPLLVVSDLDRFEIHTNFTNTVKKIYSFDLETIDQPENLRVLRALWTDPHSLRPATTVNEVTEQAAERFGDLALALHERGVEPDRTAHFLVQILFCLFAEDVGLLPKGHFSRLLSYTADYPDDFPEQIGELFQAMQSGGRAGYERIERFNGGLFATIDPVPLTGDELKGLVAASRLDWTSIEPAIIGTLFERSLDPARRSQLGAHYTGRADIERVVDPVVMTPLRRRWDEIKEETGAVLERWREAATERTQRNRRDDFARLLQGFQEQLTGVTVLDPACGSGNFLYVALNKLLDLEKEVITYGASNGLPLMFPQVRPSQLYGLEINQYAQELTQVVIWIGYLQWMSLNGFQPRRDPVLGDMDNIRLQDALLDRSDPDNPKEAAWPPADYIIGNLPFLGAKFLRRELGDTYVDQLHNVFHGRLPGFSDLCCYFFEKARAEIEEAKACRAGLLATNSIRGGSNRTVLDRIRDTGDIFMAWDDEAWVLDGAAVRISIVGFDDGSDEARYLDGVPVDNISSDLTGGVDLSRAHRLNENSGQCFLGVQLSGPFDIPGDLAREMRAMPVNPNGRPNSDVVRPVINGIDITRRPRDRWIVDFGVGTPHEEAALYEAPFEYVREHVKPMREKSRSRLRDERWWLTLWSRPEMRSSVAVLSRYLATPTVSKYRLFKWFDPYVLPNHQIVVFARDDDYFFGVLHSRAHEVWSLRMGTSLEDRPRYTPTTTFETFPFPRPTDEQREVIAAAAKRLNELRESWLNPDGATEAELKKRTLTNLYNARPTWLDQAHQTLDQAVWTAYGWPEAPSDTDDETILRRLLALNLERAGVTGSR
ncbi:class I SAM-dependent DNA methyltransferase [soil metagenome]